MPLNPWFLLGFLFACLGAGVGGFKLGSDHEVASQAREQNHIAEAVDAANTEWAASVAKIRVTNSVINNEVQHEIKTNTVYADCRATPDGVRLVNEALSGKPRPTGDSLLPRADTVK